MKLLHLNKNVTDLTKLYLLLLKCVFLFIMDPLQLYELKGKFKARA